MSQNGIPPPAPSCLNRPRPSSQKGGTLIAEGVNDLETHLKLLAERDPYRPEKCLTCLGTVLHVHEYRDRVSRGDSEAAVIKIVIHQCQGCKATWRILPLFLARMLWRVWPVVEAAVDPSSAPADAPKVPARTVRRWKARLATAALLLVQLLATTMRPDLQQLAGELGLHATRRELVIALGASTSMPVGQRMQTLAALVHRLLPGVRLA